ncbi:hypothetical protein DFS33DRAFT_1378699 [Desarmillaria ectypa]|nr:hypothetical protein DFS33DRAFT_1378699 [Desarmillaria ectypa]
MVFIFPLVGATVILSGFALALPRPDSALGAEVAVSAPNGIPLTDSAELQKQSASEAAAAASSTANGGYYGAAATTTAAMSSETMTSKAMTTEAATTTMAATYGSGSQNWGSYDNCVQQCIASFGGSAATYTAPTATSTAGSSGTGATHTVIVAPSQGVLRYVPFALNASVGDTVVFQWGANNHTVTKSSELAPCNKTSDRPFTSGVQIKDFTFSQVINDTNPLFYYCGVPTHCQKGMFAIINPPSAAMASTSVAGMMQGVAANSSSVKNYAAYTNNVTSGKPANTWGQSIDMAQLPSWAHEPVMENVLYTRNLLAMNPEVMKEDGSIDLSTASSTPLMIPDDVAAALQNAASASSSGSASSSPTAASGATSSAAASSPASSQSTHNGAGAMTSSKAFVAIMLVAATFFLV